MESKTNNQFDGMYFTGLIYKHRWFVLSSVALGTIVSVVISLLMPNWYLATVNAVPPQSSSSGLESAMGNISSALKDIGLSKVSGGGGSESYTLKVLFDSRSVKDSLIKKFDIKKHYDMKDALNEEVYEAFGANLSVYYEKDGNFLISFMDKDPKFAAEVANHYLEVVNYFAADVYKREQRLNREYMEKRLWTVDSTIDVITEKLASLTESSLMFSPVEQASAVSAALIDLKAQVYQSEIEYDILKTTYGAKDPATIMKKNFLEQTRLKLDEAMKKPGFAGNFALNQSGRIGIEYTKLFTEIEALSKAKSYLVPVYEKIKLDETKNMQTLLVLDKAIPPTKKEKPKRSIIVLGSMLGVFVLSVLIILLVYGFKDFKRKYNEISV